MRLVQVINADRGVELGRRIALADHWLSRLRGLLGRPEPQPGEGLLLVPCRSVHMMGMRYPIDVAFLDSDRRVLSIHCGLRPGPRTAGIRGARYALELPSGTLDATGTVPGNRLNWQESTL
ncbi:MAG TPA: DUF192 domain-containing protein [Gemmatimonadales bacterium]|jgi:uncharacterized membrane protein (UPF0127 family)|nr:DUF192 domain-containing protein [Gemmatimonadales bacterium]